MSVISLRVFRDSATSITAAMSDAGVHHSRRIQLSQGPVAAGWAYEVFSASNAVPWGAFAVVLVAWLRARASRKVLITLRNGETRHIEGYSASDVAALLAQAREVAAIDTQAADD